jgi:uncharacterized protein YkwD
MISKRDPITAGRPAKSLATALLLTASLFAVACSDSAASPTSPGGGMNLGQVEASSMALVNSERGGAGLGQLWFDPVLCEIARSHSQQMRNDGFVSHYDASGTAVDGRLRSAGVTFSMASENIAVVGDTQDPAGQAHRGFMASPPHRANILGERFSNVGVGVSTDGERYWVTQIFIRD